MTTTLTLPAMPANFGLTVESFGDNRWLMLTYDGSSVAAWQWQTGHLARDTEMVGFDIPDEVMTTIDSFVATEARYEWAERAHAPRNEGEKYPACGSSSASHNDLDTEPIVSSDDDLKALPDEVTCWECRSIVS